MAQTTTGASITANPTEPRRARSTTDMTWVAQGAELAARNMERVIRGKPDAVASAPVTSRRRSTQ